MTAEAPARVDVRSVLADDADAPVLPDEARRRVAEHLAAGGVLAYPTETVYGFGAAADGAGVAAVARLKGRDPSKPFLVLLPDPDHARRLAWTVEARELADVFWPGALTLVLADPLEVFPPGIRSPEGTVAVRVSPHPVARALVEAMGGPVISTSVNEPGRPSARSGDEAAAVGRALGAGDGLLVLDAGTLPESAPSTIVDCSRTGARVLREGSVPLGRLRCVLPHVGGPVG